MAAWILLLLPCVSAGHGQEGSSAVLVGPYLGQTPPGNVPALFAPRIVSTCKEHSAAMFTTDGNEVWFGRLFPARIYCMERIDNRWTEPKAAAFCDGFDCLYPVLSPDGKQIFFSSDRPIEQGGTRLPRGRVHLWMVENKAGEWSDPVHLNGNVNSGRRISCGSLAINGDLYFTSDTDNRSMDMFRSRLIDGAYSDPEKLAEIDSSEPDHSPFVARDGSYLIFSSFQSGSGRSDLFISFRKTDGAWSKPRNMGSRINSPCKDEYPFVTHDGKHLSFNSNRPSALNRKPIEDGPGNVYWVSASVIEELKKGISDEN